MPVNKILNSQGLHKSLVPKVSEPCKTLKGSTEYIRLGKARGLIICTVCSYKVYGVTKGTLCCLQGKGHRTYMCNFLSLKA